MKTLYSLSFVLILIGIQKVHAQSNVGIGTVLPNATAILDITSSSKGLLVPRMTTVQRNAIISPAQGLLVYDTDTNSFWYYNASAWTNLAAALAGSGWLLSGNAATADATNFIGTTDNNPLNIRVNNEKAGRIDKNLHNAFWGYQAGANTSSANNTAMGDSSLAYNNTGGQNSAFGVSALRSNISGTQNTAVGIVALASNNTGNFNTAVGAYSLFPNTSGYDNTATGSFSLRYNTTGYRNSAGGSSALRQNTTGNYNTAHGAQSLYNNTTGFSNVAMGVGALYQNTTVSNLVAVGDSALYNNATGTQNTAIGSKALYGNTIGSQNTGIGMNALKNNSSGILNTAIGSTALSANSAGNFNTAMGANALTNNAGSRNTATGVSALATNAAGTDNTGNGTGALYANVSGSANTGMGSDALYNNTGSNNTAMGFQALNLNTDGSNNTAVGTSATVGSSNLSNATAIGSQARADCSNCLVLGSVQGINSAASNVNVGIGVTNPNFPLSFNNNLGGKIALYGNSSSTYHGLGIQGGIFQIHSDAAAADIAFGWGSSGAFNELMRIKGTGNVGININNPQAGLHILNKDILIENSFPALQFKSGSRTAYTKFSNSFPNNFLTFGFSSNAFTILTLSDNGNATLLGTLAQNSDATLKTNIFPIASALTSILQLSGYRYNWIDEARDKEIQIGVLAQEVQKVLPELVETDAKGILSVNYSGLIPVLIEAVKEQQKQIDEQKQINIDQQKRMEKLEEQLKKIGKNG